MTTNHCAAPLGTDANLPKIVLPGYGITITNTATELYQRIAQRHGLFVRGKVPVQLSVNKTEQLVLEPLKPSAARSFFEKFGDFWAVRAGKRNEEVLKRVVMAEEMARAILDSHVAAEILPPINGLINCPVITEKNGELCMCSKGYNPETGLLITNGDKPEDVSLTEAVAALKALLADYRFQSASDYSRAIAALITPGLKMGNLIRGHVPIDVAEADQSQSGKTLRQKMVAALYGEVLALVPLKRGGVGSTDESLFEKLVNGRPFIQLDNFRGMLDSPALEALLTADRSFPCRIPGVREIEVDPSKYFIMMTSNGVQTTRDLANRANIIRICKREGVNFPDVLTAIMKRQCYFLGCIFSVIRAWHTQGKPRTSETSHDFQDWCQSLDWVVQNVFQMSPLMDGHQCAQDRVSNPGQGFLRRISLEVDRNHMLDKQLTASDLLALASTAEVQPPGLRAEDAADETKAKKILGMLLSGVFKESETIVLEGFIITRGQEDRKRTNGKGGNYPVNVYTFSHGKELASTKFP
jgi:hypothetical protein